MLVRRLQDCELFLAGDHTQLRELLHPDKQPLELRYSLAHAVVPDRKSTRLNSSHRCTSYAVFCLKKKNNILKR